MTSIRNYKISDYNSLAALYKQGELFGGQFDENRDSEEKLAGRIKADPEAILVCEDEGRIIGTISLIDDGRVAWLFRFAVVDNDKKDEVAKLLYDKAISIFKSRGHNQVLVYSPVGNSDLNYRYQQVLGFEKGTDYTCFWKDI